MRDENVSGVILAPARRLPGHRLPVSPSSSSTAAIPTPSPTPSCSTTSRPRASSPPTSSSGRRRILFLHGASSATGRQRLEGYTAAMAAHGLPPETVGVAPVADRSREVAQVLLARPALPDAVLASSGLILLGLAQALRDAGRRVPGDVAIAGFDDQPWTRLVEPAITVIAQPTYAIGREAAELLLHRISDPDQPVRRVVLRGELVARGSSAAAS